MAEIFMKYGSIQGNATFKGKEKWIVVDNVTQATSRPLSMDTGKEQEDAGVPFVGDLKLYRSLDMASTAFMNNCLKGTETDAEIDFIKPEAEGPYKTINITQVLVTNYACQIGAKGGSETLTLSFVDLDMEIKEGGDSKASWGKKAGTTTKK
jgi:type VI protein secretion system component Hcp